MWLWFLKKCTVHDCSSDSSSSSAITDVHTPTNVEHDELKICAAIEAAAAAAAAAKGTVNLFGAAHRKYNQMVSTWKDI